MKKFLALFAVMFGIGSASHAGIMIEPYLGYEMGKLKDLSEGSLDGSQAGLRLAYTLPVLFWLGVDGTTTISATVKPDLGANEDAKRTTMYGVVGVDFPILLRAWVGYSVVDELKLETSGKFKGSSYKVGFGFTGLPFLSLNLEYVNEQFDELEGVSLPQDQKNDSYVLSVSLPLEF